MEGVPRPSPVKKFPFSAPPGSPVGQALRPCRRLHIGALRSPLSPFAPSRRYFPVPPPTPQRPPSSREGDRPQAVEGVPAPVPGGKVPFLNPTGFTRRSSPPALPPIAYRGFAVAPITLRPLSKSLIQPRVQGRNPARFNGGYGVPRGFKGEKSKSPPNPLGLAERVPRPHSVEGVPPSHPAYSEPFSRIALSTPSLLRYPSISRITVSGGSGVPASAQILTACIRNSLSL